MPYMRLFILYKTKTTYKYYSSKVDTDIFIGMSTNSQTHTPTSTIHIGSDATHVTVHIHHHYQGSESSDTSTSLASERRSSTNVASGLRSPFTPTPRYNERRPSSERPLRATISSALSALPEGILSPTLQSVVAQALHGETTATGGQHLPIRTSERQQEQNDRDTTARPSNQREQNVAISFMMQPMAGRSVSLMDLFQQFTQDGDDANSNNGISMTELNRHTTIETYDSQNSRHDTCAVCRELFTPGQPVRRIGRCGHVFHTTCMDRWLETHSTCPLCMQHIVPNEDDSGSTTETPSEQNALSSHNQNSTTSPRQSSSMPTNPLSDRTNVTPSSGPVHSQAQRQPDDELLNSAIDELRIDHIEDVDTDDSREHFV